MQARQLARGVATVGVLGIGAGGLVLGGAAAPASAFTGTCPSTVPASTLVADGVCEVRMTTSGTFTPPAGIAKLAAVLVAGGGGAAITSEGFYAGDAGNVSYLESTSVTAAPIPVVVGSAGQPAQDPTESSTSGTDTSVGTVTAVGGLAGGIGQALCYDGTNFFGFGQGARTQASGDPDCIPGLGFGLADLPSTDPALFPASAAGVDVYGDGGDATDVAGPIAASAIAGTGGSVTGTAAAAGSSGLVIFRYQAPAIAPAVITPAAPELAATGADIPWSTPALAVAAILGGAVLMRTGRRQTRA